MRIHWRGDPAYEEARLAAVWNELKPDRFPAAIVYAESEDDVVDAVNLAREQGLKVKARSGGHSWTGSSVRDDSIHVNLAALDSVTVDPETRTATVQPGHVFLPMHFAAVNQLTFPSFDPHSRQPSYKACAVALAHAGRRDRI